MNVRELREALEGLPDHWPVHVEVRADHGGEDYFFTLDVQRDNFPTHGNMAVIRIDYEPNTAGHEAAYVAARRQFRSGFTAGVPSSSNDQPNALRTDSPLAAGKCLHGLSMTNNCAACAAERKPHERT